MGGLQQQIHQVLAKLQGARERQQEVALAQQQQQEEPQEQQQELEQQYVRNQQQQQQQEEQQRHEDEALVGELELSSLGDGVDGIGSRGSVPAASLAAAAALLNGSSSCSAWSQCGPTLISIVTPVTLVTPGK